MPTLAIDFGGTQSRAALVSKDGMILRRQRILSRVDDPLPVVLDRLISLGKSVLDGESLDTIGVAAPGPLDPRHGIILHAETLPGWQNVPLAAIIQEAFGNVPTFIQNDANLGAVAEYRLGVGKGADPLIYMTISTGIGGGAVIGGKLFSGWSGLAIEPGHIRLTLPNGLHYRLEELASGTAIGFWARRRLAESTQPSQLRTLKTETIDGRAVGLAAQAGDSLALDIIQQAGEYLGLGLMTLLHLFSPEVIVFGGSVTQLGNLLLDPARRIMKENASDPAFFPPDLIRISGFADDICLLGAALYAQSQAGI